MTDTSILENWYRFVSDKPGFIGYALRKVRIQHFMLQEQQRAMLGLQGQCCDFAWLRLQGLYLPRNGELFNDDVGRIAQSIGHDDHIVHAEALVQLLSDFKSLDGLEEDSANT